MLRLTIKLTLSLGLCCLQSIALASGLFSFEASAPQTKSNEQPTSLMTKHYVLHYRSNREVAAILNDKRLHYLSSRAHVHITHNPHHLWIADDETHLSPLKSWLQDYDKPIPSLLIQARIVSIDDAASSQIGALFRTYAKSDQRPSVATEQIPLPLARLKGGYLLDATLEALEQKGHATLISKPELVTLNNTAASIESGHAIPYQEITRSGGTSVTFKKAVLRLQVTPTVLFNKTLQLTIRVKQDAITDLHINGTPAIHTQSLNTTAQMQSGETLMLGGIIEKASTDTWTGIPLLSHIPLIGRLFQHKKKSITNRELLIFITPKLIKRPA